MRHAHITIVKAETQMSTQKIVEIIIRVCGKHDKEFNAFGLCADCCGEDHRCEKCGVWSHESRFSTVEWRGTLLGGLNQMLCDDCVECADCGSGVEDTRHHSEYDEILCVGCAEDRDEEWKREEQEREARSASTLA